MKNKKIVSLLLAACLSIGAMSVNVWAENGNEQKEETPAPVVQEVEGEKPEETKPEETKPEETKPEETPVATPEAASYGTDVVASERKLETLVTYHIQMVDKDGKPIKDTTFEVRGPVGRKLTTSVGEKVTGSDENGWLDLTVVDPHMAGSGIGNMANDFYLQAPDGTWYWANLGPNGVYVLYVYTGSMSMPWLDFAGKDENNNYKNFKRVTLKEDQTPDPTGTFTIVKVDKDDTTKKLTGAQFTLTALNENGEPASEPDYENTTDANGEAKFENVPLGKYILKETVAPQGYQLPVDVTYEIGVRENDVYIEGDDTLIGENNTFYIKNTKITTPIGNFTITKVDADTGAKLAGAEFQLRKDGWLSAFDTKVTDANGVATFANIPAGKYTLTETVAPQGYVKPNEIYTVKVNENGKISVWKVTAPSGGDFTVTLPDDFIIQNPDGNVVVKDKNFVVENTKEAPGTTSYTFMKHGVVTTVDSNGRTIRTTESPLAGAEFTLYDAEENMLQTVRSAVDGSVTFSNLIDGGYYIIKETKAPSGYIGWNGRIKLSVHFDEQGKPEIRVLVEYLSEDREENITGELTVRNYTTVKETEHPVDNRPNGPTYRYDDDDDYVLPTVTRKDNKKPANKPERAPRVEEVIPSKRNPETGSSSSMPIAMAAAAVSLTGLVVLCKKKDK